MKKVVYILSAVVLALAAWAAMLWLRPTDGHADAVHETRYGVSEGLQLVEQTTAHGDRLYVVEDARGRTLFRIPLRGCILDTRFRGGRLAFREVATGREGYVDWQGMVTFTAAPARDAARATAVHDDRVAAISGRTAAGDASVGGPAAAAVSAPVSRRDVKLPSTDIRRLAHDNPFYAEAAKILHGRLTDTDAASRRQILNYCEHLRTAYTTKDVDFLRQVFSDDALIIVGNVVRTSKEPGRVQADSRVSYALHTKRDYLARLAKVFAANRQVVVRFSDFRIMRHPTKDGIYGVSLRQRYRSDRYSDDGWLFLLWDFRNASMPLIHVRTWQPSDRVEGSDGVVDISDFNLE